jgi:cytochrome c biogenesis protein
MTELDEGTSIDLGSAPQAPERPPRLTAWGYVRYSWRQLTSMRTALVLLFLVALAAVPGSLLPQHNTNPIRVRDYFIAHPRLAPIFDRRSVSLFDVYSSWWFSATYLLLFISLAGCVIPRAAKHYRAMRARPPAAPRRLERLPESAVLETSLAVDEAAQALRDAVRRTRFRVDLVPELDGAVTVRAEKGFLRETGNLVFHLALLVLLLGVAVGGLFGYKGTVLVVEGDSFVNAAGNYDDFMPGHRFRDSALAPFTLTLEHFAAQYYDSGDKAGTAKRFDATLRWSPRPGAPTRSYDLQVNHPLVMGQTKVYLLGDGYAPEFTVRDDTGKVAFQGPVPFLPQDSQLSSTGVVKVPGAQPQQLGLDALFTPTTRLLQGGVAVSTFPAALAPAVSVVAYRGNLGLESGVPQSVYRLDTSRMTKADRFVLAPGQTHQIGAGKASVTFDGYRMWTNLQVTYDPGKDLALAAAAAMVLGLLLSLRVRRRRVWVRARPAGAGRTVVEMGGLARTDESGFRHEFADLVSRARSVLPAVPTGAAAPTDREE